MVTAEIPRRSPRADSHTDTPSDGRAQGVVAPESQGQHNKDGQLLHVVVEFRLTRAG